MTSTTDAPAARVTAPTVVLDNVGKSYGSTSVLRDVSLTIVPGEIHGLLGENGAGKSTLLKILGGAVVADAGSVSFDGERVRIGSPRDAIDLGVSLIAQELALVPQRSVLENIFLGRWRNTAGFARTGADRAHAERLIRDVGFALDLDAPVSSLSLGQAQQVEIVKALARGSQVLCLDEPTAALGEQDTENLLRVLRQLAARGTTIIIVSHFLDEILGLADRITVLRDGDQIITDDAAGYTADSLVSLMVGRQMEALERSPEPVAADAEVAIRVSGLGNHRISDISFEVRRGEILGLAGLMGSGRSETLNAVFGGDRVTSGEVWVEGRKVRRNSVRAGIRSRIALVPESRKDQGLVLGRSASDNIALPSLGRRQRAGFIGAVRERAIVDSAIQAVDIRGRVQNVSVGALSGGNQQKVLFAKWLVDPPAVFLIDEPTRGVDVAAKANIHRLILELAAAGTAVIVASSELEEVLSLSHRVVVMKKGRIVAEFDRTASADEVMTAAFL
ncbi:sugar ABC transporter ATP-binding protein [Microbacterium sp. ASV81]|uniref:Sugar ABC transporter ATP-binding protein n=2 Tax=Microbacterium capsulatum TaxID=3041921 RepID=A0ABU0XKF7_9MICO|nr:sugar ABC transporter ATP-binding protein [Microbacterium sp. ASV81]MDQ4215608.1 sugar ABC transporter ATP-binding protein [Microbacterium sp. ASV81]